MKKLFIAATNQNGGKTTVALGLLLNLKNHFKKIGFIKPIGQRYLLEAGYQVDEDSVLIENIFKFSFPLKFLNPIAVERGFTERYIDNPYPEDITSNIVNSYQRIAESSDLVIIEGTGHAGVGSVFDHSNARVAKILDAKVLIISSGGVGKPVDEIVLNKALFDKEGAVLIGAVVNKVLKEKYEKISALVSKGLKRLGVDELGTIPYNPMLSAPTVGQISDEMGLSIISSKDRAGNSIEKIIIAAMEPQDAFRYIGRNTLIITPGDREDVIIAAIKSCSIPDTNDYSIAGILLTGGILPNKRVLNKIERTRIPILISESDTYTAASAVYGLNVKLRSIDHEKINLVKDIVGEYVNLERILNSI